MSNTIIDIQDANQALADLQAGEIRQQLTGMIYDTIELSYEDGEMGIDHASVLTLSDRIVSTFTITEVE